MPAGVVLWDIAPDGRVLLNRSAPRGDVIWLPPGELKQRALSWFDSSAVADLSPDGNTLLFHEWGAATGGAPFVYLRHSDGKDAVRLGPGRGLALSPDGKWALTRQETTPPTLVLLPTGAGQPKTLPIPGIASVLYAFWFPDGRRISFVGMEAGHAPRSYLLELDADKPVPLTDEGVAAILLSPDARRVVAVAGGEYSILPMNGGAATPILGLEPGDVPVQWSADGRELFVRAEGQVSAPVYRLDLVTARRTLWKVLEPLDPAGVESISEDAGFRIGPDGRSYAFTYYDDRATLYVATGLQ
jgi:dipeptidyl aminopeptidase/acylaminoacyl peptidase